MDISFAIVEFTKLREVEVVPFNWIRENKKKCYWPKYRTISKVQTAVRQSIVPNSQDFELWDIKVMYETNDYDKARKKLRQAESQSDLQTEAEEESSFIASGSKRKRRPTLRYESEESESEQGEGSHDEEILHRHSTPKKGKSTAQGSMLMGKNTSPRRSPRKRIQNRTFPSLPTLPSPSEFESSLDHDHGATVVDLVSNARRLLEPKSPALASRPQGLEVKLLTCMEQIKMQVQQNKKLLDKILAKMEKLENHDVMEDGSIDVPNEFPELPLQNVEQLQEFETCLKNDDIKKQMIKKLVTVGGDDVKQNVRRLMTKCFSNELAKQFNWMGKGQKRAFSSLYLKDVIIKTVRRNKACSDTTDKAVEDVIKDWLRYACDRCGGRKDRRKSNDIQNPQ